MIKADILLDSVNSCGNRITTWILTYPKFIHSEFLTHRVFSRNASSSRAIPVKKMIDDVKNNPAMPVFWGKNQSGMQAAVELDNVTRRRRSVGKPLLEYSQWEHFDTIQPHGTTYWDYDLTDLEYAKYKWLEARDQAIRQVEGLVDLGLHKQISNRILEPWMHITVIATATEMGNFFALRAHVDAQPEFRALAYLMLEKYNESIPTDLGAGGWHIPFGDRIPEGISLEDKLKIATARCARTSYMTFEGEIDPQKDYELHDRLMTSGHWSPFEHCAKANWNGAWSGNFKGWTQYRKSFFNENRDDKRITIK